MKNNLSLVCENRLKNVLVMDKKINESLISVLKCDVLQVLKNYMDISADELDLNIDIDEYGFYNVCISARVKRLIPFSHIPN